MKKIGIYSGTFDPVHNGHITFAEEAIRQCNLSKVFLMVEPRPRRKQGVKAFEHRTSMAKLAIKGNSKLGLITIDQERFSTRETLPYLMARFEGAQLYMLMGDDMLNHLADWPDIGELIGSVYFIIGVRKKTQGEVENTIRNIEKARGFKIKYELFVPSAAEYSSSKIKTAIKKHKDHTGLDQRVSDYIRAHNLYVLDGE